MKSFSERNPFVIAAIGVTILIAVALGALNYDKVPFLTSKRQYQAYFAESGGLVPGAAVQVSGFKVGEVDSLRLDDARILVKFNIDKEVNLGDRTEVAIKAKSLLGSKILEITPRGEGTQSGPIPLDRTQSPYQLPDALGDLTATISGLNTDELSRSMVVLSDAFKETPPALREAVAGVARFSDTLNKRDNRLRGLLADASKVTQVLADRSDKLVDLIQSSNALLAELNSQSAALDQLSGNVSALTRQLKVFIEGNQQTFKPALEKLNGVMATLDNRKEQLQKSINMLGSYLMSLGESSSSGPFLKSYIANLLPGQFMQPFIDAAFSDLGLDPAVLLPTERTDPQVGQPGTPAMPVPFPRTGQGGEPKLDLPAAITGNPGDPRYPYREPLPVPAPGGPPPGPPAPSAQGTGPLPGPTPVYATAPNEVPPMGAGQ